MVKFRFSEKAIKFGVVHLVLTLLSNIKSKWKITPNFSGLLRKPGF